MFLRKIKRALAIALALATIVLSLCACVGPVKEDDSEIEKGSSGESQSVSPVKGDKENGGDSSEVDDNGDAADGAVEAKEKYVSVDFIDVGDGECIYVSFPDGKDLLIDCGSGIANDAVKVKEILDEKSGGELDYFILTHPDDEHIGYAENVLKNYAVKKLFVPKILEENLASFSTFKNVLDRASATNVETEYSDYYDFIKGEGYALAFLSPKPKRGSYDRFNVNPTPTAAQVNDLSPIIYLEIYGRRIILTGDAGVLEEQTVLDTYSARLYANYLEPEGIFVTLENADILKVSDGGADSASSQEFLNLLSPENAIFFADGRSGKPSTNVMKRLQTANGNYNIYRTDVCGSVYVTVYESGKLTIETEESRGV